MGARLAYVDGHGRICCRGPEEGEERVLLSEWVMDGPDGRPDRVLYRWPTWSPVGDRIAAEALAVRDQRIVRRVLWSVTPDGLRAEAVRELSEGDLVYMQWAGTEGGLILLVQEDGGALGLIRARDGTVLVRGAPLFPATSPDGSVLAHVFAGHRGRARLVGFRRDETSPRVVSDRPGSFRAPCAIEGGRLLLTVREEASERVIAWSAAGGLEVLPWTIGSVGRVSLLADPAGRKMIATGPDPSAEFDRLELLDGGGALRLLHSTPFSAALPLTGSRVLLVCGEASGAQSLRLLEPCEREPRELLRFVPTEEEALRLAFLDQYQRSHSPVAPDERAVAVGGVDVRAARLPTEPQVYLVPLDAGAEPRSLGPGRFAVWSPVSSLD